MEIEITLNTGRTKIDALVITKSGKLAVHRSVDVYGWFSEHIFTITHLPTGWAVCTNARYHQPLRSVRALANRLDKLDWDFNEACKLPAETFNACHALMDGRYCRPGYSEDFKRVCFSDFGMAP